MNERIKEITGQVLDELVPETWVSLGYDKIKEIQYRTAELIVQECMELAKVEKSRYANLYNKETDQNQYLTMLHCATSMDNYRFLLKEHFGVK